MLVQLPCTAYCPCLASHRRQGAGAAATAKGWLAICHSSLQQTCTCALCRTRSTATHEHLSGRNPNPTKPCRPDAQRGARSHPHPAGHTLVRPGNFEEACTAALLQACGALARQQQKWRAYCGRRLQCSRANADAAGAVCLPRRKAGPRALADPAASVLPPAAAAGHRRWRRAARRSGPPRPHQLPHPQRWQPPRRLRC